MPASRRGDGTASGHSLQRLRLACLCQPFRVDPATPPCICHNLHRGSRTRDFTCRESHMLSSETVLGIQNRGLPSDPLSHPLQGRLDPKITRLNNLRSDNLCFSLTARCSGNPRRRSTLRDKPGLGLEGSVHPQTNVSALGPGELVVLCVLSTLRSLQLMTSLLGH